MLTIKQCILESAIGSLKKAATVRAEDNPQDPAVENLLRLALEAKSLREPHVIEFLERKRMKRVQAGVVS